jgi:sensor c-di-GMP phosphodiesterase-like protein
VVGGPIDQDRTWSTVLLAFAIWAVHFFVAYGAALIFPRETIVLWIALAAFVGALAALAWLWLRRMRTPLGRLAIALAGLFVVYDTLPALLS